MLQAKKKTPAKKPSKLKIRVDELAQELKIDVKSLLSTLKDLGIAAKTKASSVEEESVKIVKDLLVPKKVHVIKTVQEPVKVMPAAVPQDRPGSPLPEPPAAEPAKDEPNALRIVYIPSKITLKDLAAKINVKPSELIKELMLKKMLVTINQQIDIPMAADIALKFGVTIEEEIKETAKKGIREEEDSSKLRSRPPVVTIMGHVDHGKTKLLDAIRKTNVIDTEAGGITQHIGAYQVEIKGKTITFLDTPGHEAFTALRARGANVTDIVVLVVAADDGVMPQTKEAIDHAKASNSSIIVAINKIDKPGANADRVKQQLSDLDLMPEEWGGKTVTVPVSAKQGTGIEQLLEMILLVADMLELKADPTSQASGVVIESYLDKNMGPVATVLIQRGTLRIGDAFYSGSTSGKVRALINDKGKRISKAGPSTPIEIIGISEVPVAGDLLQVVGSDKEARVIAEKKKQELFLEKTQGKVFSLEDFSLKVKSGEVRSLNLIIKGDVQGSVEALTKSLQELSAGNIKTHLVMSGTGNMTRSDVMLAKASEAIIIGFNVDFDPELKGLAESEGVDARQYSIIYNVIDDIKLALEGLLEPEYEQVITGHAEVRQLFKFSKIGIIIGSFITDGIMKRGAGARVIRNKEQIFEGKIDSLKRFKDDVKEVATGLECGIVLSDFQKVNVGDIIETFETRIKKKSVKA